MTVREMLENSKQKMIFGKIIFCCLKSAFSSLLNIVIAVITAKEQAKSISEFISLLEQKGIKTTWQDDRKYITFSDSENHKVRNKKLSETFKINLDKEVLLNEFNQQRKSHAS